MSLSNVLRQLNIIRDHSGRNDKEDLISKFIINDDFKKVVFYALNPFMQFKTNRIKYMKNIEFYKAKCSSMGTNEAIFTMLDYLASKPGATDQDITYLSAYASIDLDTVEVVRRIITKDLDCGAAITTFRKYLSILPDYSVMLCKDELEKFLKICPLHKMLWSEKLDGVRCTSYTNLKFDKSDTSYLSRNGKTFPNFQIFTEEVTKFYTGLHKLYPGINYHPLDGEATAETKNKKDKKTFQKLMTQISRLSEVDPNLFRFNIFDIIIPNTKLSERYSILYKTFKYINEEHKLQRVRLLPHYLGSNFKAVTDLLLYVDDVVDNHGWEGLVLKDPDSLYENKRSKYWCKVKKFFTDEFPVIRFEYGNKKYSNVVGKLICEINGKEFGCGSGLTDKERKDFLDELPQIIEVKYQELTEDGVPRFPTYVRPREDK